MASGGVERGAEVEVGQLLGRKKVLFFFFLEWTSFVEHKNNQDTKDLSSFIQEDVWKNEKVAIGFKFYSDRCKLFKAFFLMSTNLLF